MEFNARLEKIAGYPSAVLAEKKKQLLTAGKEVFDFGTGDPIEPTPEFIRTALAKGIPVVSQYPTVKGVPELRSAIQGYVKRRFGVELDVNTQILPVTGSKEGIYNLSFVMVGPESKKNIIIAPSPGYPVPERSAVVANAEFYRFELNDANKYILDLSTLPKEILERTSMAWINYPHNPTGVEIDLEYLKKQVAIAKQYNFLLCSDECYVDIYFSGKQPPSVLQVATEGVLAFHSCSKRSGMTAYRSGFAAGDKEVIKKYAALRETIGVATPEYTQYAAAAAWSDDTHVIDRLKIFAEKREIFIDFFRKHNLNWIKTDSTLYFWVKCPRGKTGREYATELLEDGIIVGPGESFSPSAKEYFRIAIVPSAQNCKKALKIWESHV